MKRISSLLLTFALVLGLCACGQKASASDWQTQYDLGVRYLSEGNYEEAVIAFTAAIEIDPKRPEAYLDMAYAYIGQNDFDAAREILERGYELTQDDALKAKLDELDSGNITDYLGNARKTSYYDGSGALLGYQIHTYDNLRPSSVTSFDAAGNQTGHVDLAFSDAGKQLVSYCSNGWDGMITARIEQEYDSNGNMVKEQSYDLSTGKLEYCYLNQYDEQGRCVRLESYSDGGALKSYTLYTYGENSTRQDHYNADGTLTSYIIANYREDGAYSDNAGYSADGTVNWRYIYLYDDAGKQISTEAYGSNDVLEQRTVYRYDDTGKQIASDTYDGEGNLIRTTEYN